MQTCLLHLMLITTIAKYLDFRRSTSRITGAKGGKNSTDGAENNRCWDRRFDTEGRSWSNQHTKWKGTLGQPFVRLLYWFWNPCRTAARAVKWYSGWPTRLERQRLLVDHFHLSQIRFIGLPWLHNRCAPFNNNPLPASATSGNKIHLQIMVKRPSRRQFSVRIALGIRSNLFLLEGVQREMPRIAQMIQPNKVVAKLEDGMAYNAGNIQDLMG